MPEQAEIFSQLLDEQAVARLLLGLSVLAIASMALTGVIQAIRSDFDYYGAGILGMITAVGGGTVRDVMLGAPVFWVHDATFLMIVILVTYIGIIYARRLRSGRGSRQKLLDRIDSIGLSLFTILGTNKALTFGVEPIIAIFLGCVTGVVGGMIRDMFTGQTPSVLKPGELYATISLFGGVVFVNLRQSMSLEMASLISFVLMVGFRLWVIQRDLKSTSL